MTIPMPKFARRTTLAEHVEAGSQVVASAALVGDSDDFVVWLQRCMEWRAGVDDHLATRHGAEAVQRAREAAAAIRLEGSWQERLAAEIARVDVVRDLLRALADGASDGGDAATRAEPVGARSEKP